MAELREALEDAIKQSETVEAAAPEAASAPETTTDIAAASSVESESAPSVQSAEGESAPALEDGGDAAQGAKADKPAAPPVEGEQETPAQRAAHRVDRAPQSWKKEAKAIWNELPLHVRQEVHRREGQVNQVLAEASKNREVVDQFNKVTMPYQARLQTMGGAIPAVERLLQVENTLASGTRQQGAQLIAQLIKDYEIDIATLDSMLAGEPQAQQAPDINQIVQQQLQQALAPLYQQRQQQAQKVQQEAVQTVEQMSLDPQFPFFDDVREEMADIIDMKARKGVAISLQDAYHMAVQMNPTVTSQMRQQSTIQSATQQHQQAQRAKVAASSVSGSPASGGSLATVGDGSLRGAIEAAFGGQRL